MTGGRSRELQETVRLLRSLAATGSLEAALERMGGLDRPRAQALLAEAADRLEAAPPAPARGAAAVSPAPSEPGGEPPVGSGPVGRVRVFCDGAARGNPGPAGAGAVIEDASGRILARLGRHLGRATNNVAEYEALLLGLRHARRLGAREVQVVSDSELLVKQLHGLYKVKAPHLQTLHRAAVEALRAFDRSDVVHVLRAENAAADEMANRAIDEALDD